MKRTMRITIALCITLSMLFSMTGSAFAALLPRVTAVAVIPNTTVAYGTTLTDARAKLPSTVVVTLSNGTKTSASLVWDLGTPIYNGTVSRTYVFKSPLTVIGATVPLTLATVKANVIVAKNITSISAVQIPASYGASLAAVKIRLPKTVALSLNNGTSRTVSVTWTNPTSFDSSTIGAFYTFAGTFTLPADVQNPNNIQANAVVLITNGNSDPNPSTKLNTSAGTTLIEFDSVADWNASASASMWQDTDNCISGSASTTLGASNPISVSGTNNTYFSVTTAQLVSDRLTGIQNIEFNLFVPDKSQIDYILVNFYTDSSHNYFFQNAIGIWELSPGWNKIRRPVSDIYFVNSIPSVTSTASVSATSSRTAAASLSASASSVKTSKVSGAKSSKLLSQKGIFDESQKRADLMAEVDNFNAMLTENNQIKQEKQKAAEAAVKMAAETAAVSEKNAAVETVAASEPDKVTEPATLEEMAITDASRTTDIGVKVDTAATETLVTSAATTTAAAPETVQAGAPAAVSETTKANEVSEVTDTASVTELAAPNETSTAVEPAAAADTTKANEVSAATDTAAVAEVAATTETPTVADPAAATAEVAVNDTTAAAETAAVTEEVPAGLATTAIPSSWASIDNIEIFVVSKTGAIPIMNIDKIAFNVTGSAKILFTFDDAWYDVKQYAEPVMSAKGFKATAWANKTDSVAANSITTRGALDVMNETDLAELYAKGWDIGNHTVNHIDNLATLTVAKMKSEYLTNQNWLVSKGWTRGAYHACYPSGSYNASLIEVLKGIGAKSGRVTEYGIQPTPVCNVYKLKTVFISRDTSVADITAQIDKAAATGSSLFFMLHRVEDVPIYTDESEYNPLAVSTDKFSQIVDYVSNLSSQGLVDVDTISEWYTEYTTP